MKVVKVVAALILSTAIAGTAWSQGIGGRSASSPEILGYLNPRSNSFRPMYMQTAVSQVSSPAAVSVATGKLVANFGITVSSVIPATAAITCSLVAIVNDVNPTTFVLSNNVSEQATVVATRSTGTAKCTVTIPYSWTLTNRTTDQIQLIYSVDASFNSTTAATVVNRSSSQTMATFAIPANAVITTKTVAVTF